MQVLDGKLDRANFCRKESGENSKSNTVVEKANTVLACVNSRVLSQACRLILSLLVLVKSHLLQKPAMGTKLQEKEQPKGLTTKNLELSTLKD